MKKNIIGMLLLAGVILASCGSKTENTAMVTTEIETTKETVKQTEEKEKETQEETKEENKTSESKGASIQINLQESYSDGAVTFGIDPQWTPIPKQEGMFATADQKAVYGMNGISELGSATPKEFHLGLEEIYGLNMSMEEKSDELMEWKSSDGVTCQTATMLMKAGEDYFAWIEIVIAPDKNLVVTFMGQYGDENQEEEVKAHITAMRESMQFLTGAQDYISGYTFMTDETSQLCLKDDKSFYFYQSEKKHNQNYYVGTYDVYYGQDAFDYLDQSEDYAGSKERLEEVLRNDMSGYRLKTKSLSDLNAALYPDLKMEESTSYQICRDTFYVLVLHNDYVVLTNGETKDGGYDTTYLGYYIPELNIADFANPKTGGYFNWNRQGKTAEMDVEPEK